MNDKTTNPVPTGATPTSAPTPLIRLKQMSAEDRARIMEILKSGTYSEVRPEVEKITGFPCTLINLSRFYSWQSVQQIMERTRALRESIESCKQEEAAEISPEKLGQEALEVLEIKAINENDLKALRTVVQIQSTRLRDVRNAARLKLAEKRSEREERRLELQRQKLELLHKTKLDVGLDELGAYLRKDSEARNHFEKLEALIKGKLETEDEND